MNKQCPSCGALEKDCEFEGAFCPKCAPKFAPKPKKLKPSKIKLPDYCTRCHRHREGRIWVDGEPEKYERRTCIDCVLQSGGYHEAVIQLRGSLNKTRALAKRLSKRIREKTRIVSKRESKYGVDLLVLRKRPALEAVQGSKHKYTKADKLVTQRRDGRRLFRTTLCIRLDE